MGEFPTPPKSKIRSRMPLLQDHLQARRRILSESPQDSRQGLGVGAGARSLVGVALPPTSTPHLCHPLLFCPASCSSCSGPRSPGLQVPR